MFRFAVPPEHVEFPDERTDKGVEPRSPQCSQKNACKCVALDNPADPTGIRDSSTATPEPPEPQPPASSYRPGLVKQSFTPMPRLRPPRRTFSSIHIEPLPDLRGIIKDDVFGLGTRLN